MAKRRKLPEEDLAAAVADILSSPITRANLSFLSPLPPRPPEFGTEPVGSSVKPMESAGSETPAAVGCDRKPMGVIPKPMGEWQEPTGVSAPPPPPPPNPGPVPDLSGFWQAEGAPETLFPAARVHRLVRAADALSAAEERVYRLLWQSGAAQEADGPARLAQLSLQRIAAQAQLNIRTVRLLLPRLIEKGFAEVAAEADVRRNLPTAYRLWSEAELLERFVSQGRRHVVKTGRGVFFAHPIGRPQGSAEEGTRPVGFTLKPMGDGLAPMGLGLESTGTYPAPYDELAQLCRTAFQAEPDRALLESMVEACHRQALQSTGTPATVGEILYFVRLRADVIGHSANIRNHLAVLARSVPECFTGPALLAHRAESGLEAMAKTSGS